MKSTAMVAYIMLALAGSIWIAPARTLAASGAETGPARAANPGPKKAAQDRTARRVLSDVTLTARVKAALIQDKVVSAREINVDTVKGVVHLRGTVHSKAELKKAVAVTRKVEGVRAVKSHLQFVPGQEAGRKDAAPDRSVGRVLDDVTVTGKVKSALIQDKYVSASEINVDTVKGIVHLKGKVDRKAEAARAVALTRKVEGVQGVKSHLQIVANEKTAGYREEKGGKK